MKNHDAVADGLLSEIPHLHVEDIMPTTPQNPISTTPNKTGDQPGWRLDLSCDESQYFCSQLTQKHAIVVFSDGTFPSAPNFFYQLQGHISALVYVRPPPPPPQPHKGHVCTDDSIHPRNLP